ncbi:L-histidine N(alpha)-methyltransferase [Magnetococcus sp. PR-3]|uniref:L-histidine N(alpha)-methyltransferase n=1 Tax=Magnetococcus sp. PR-3 TaxID=3120355 RepID=UPI002FCDFF9A
MDTHPYSETHGFTAHALQELEAQRPSEYGTIRGFYDTHPTLSELKAEVIEGLSNTPKQISPKFFYDAYGSKLFDAITELPEYYPTRTEIALIRQHGAEMARMAGTGSVLVELGSGSSLKVQLLLEALKPAAYVPIDISRQHLLESAESLAKSFPHTAIFPVCADYSKDFHLPEIEEEAPRLAFFPGSSIGNFEPKDAVTLLGRVAKLLGHGGGLIIGVDLPKDPQVLHAAYNDAQGVTAQFNVNLLTRINREASGHFNLSQFTHDAFFNEDLSRIEMHLKSTTDQIIKIGDHSFTFEKDETIHTESSYKYSVEAFRDLASTAGFHSEALWMDEEKRFSIHFMRVGKSN